ncbi:hypothetical protein ACU8DI_00430 [Psychroserpens sp. BH13MA-6]
MQNICEMITFEVQNELIESTNVFLNYGKNACAKSNCWGTSITIGSEGDIQLITPLYY